jgi:tRNA A-37 threonylcarbamoyl transferase component Bud32
MTIQEVDGKDPCNIVVPLERFDHIVKTALGSDFPFGKIERINDGYSKHSYIIFSRDERERYIFQVWQKPDSQLPSVESEETATLWPEGLAHFIRSTQFLLAHGINVPHIIHADFAESKNAPDLAIIQYIYGKALSQINIQDLSDNTIADIGEMLGLLHGTTRSRSGWIDKPDPENHDCLQFYLRQLLQYFDIASLYDEFVNESRKRIFDAVDFLFGQIEKRHTFNLVHGDLVGNHVIISPSGKPFLIDYESCRFFELESEYCSLEADLHLSSPVFKNAYFKHVVQRIDRDRVLFYRIALCLFRIAVFSKANRKDNGVGPRFSIQLKNAQKSLSETLNAAMHQR